MKLSILGLTLCMLTASAIDMVLFEDDRCDNFDENEYSHMYVICPYEIHVKHTLTLYTTISGATISATTRAAASLVPLDMLSEQQQ
jgi:hypothetical protein